VRPDVSIDDVVKMVGGIAKIQGRSATVERILSVALDGLRYRNELIRESDANA
jgi:hypothetical protein